MTLEMVYYPDPRLRERSKEITKIPAELKKQIPEMFEVMYRHRGIGLAGPQVGVLQRIIVANIKGDPKEKETERVFINPQIVKKSGTMNEEEGCLSLPGLNAKIKRSSDLVVQFFDLDGQAWEMEVDGLYAKLFQHEIDHLDGVLMIDKMSAADLKAWKPLLAEMEEDFMAGRAPARRRDRRPPDEDEEAAE
jgi:peptide deformylase